jgi:hypothetical protein|tara:strand:- start:1308 stop:1649 length:342 start_codon:yes stop_codon:yes gene_type:complete
MPVFRVDKIVYLDKFTKCYKNIFVIQNSTNDTSLNLITQTISLNKLSPFQTFSQCCENPSCVKTFINNQNGEILTEKNIDILFSQLINAGYNIEYKMTKLIKDKKLVCFISKN